MFLLAWQTQGQPLVGCPYCTKKELFYLRLVLDCFHILIMASQQPCKTSHTCTGLTFEVYCHFGTLSWHLSQSALMPYP